MTSETPRPFNVYLASEATASLDSFEGIPEVSHEATSDRLQLKYAWQRKLHGSLDSFGDLAPGLLLAAAVALIATFVAKWLGTSVMGFDRSPVSPILATVVLGLVLRNLIGLPKRYRDGLSWCVKRILRIGVALLGLGLSLAALGSIGLHAIPVVIGCILTAILGVIWLGKLAGLSNPLSTLIAVGTSICGVTAIVATGPAIDADDDEVSYSVAVITLFGILALLTYPFLAHFLFAGDPRLAGFFLGTAIHDTSQVAGAGLMYQLAYDSPEALDVAATTKLVRNLCLGAVIPVMAILHQRRSRKEGYTPGKSKLGFSKLVPGFVIAFIALAALRSIGDMGGSAFGIFSRDTWEGFLSFSRSASLACLTVALAAIGLGTSFLQIRNLGFRPLVIGFAAATLVGAVSVGLIQIFVA